MKEYVNNKLSKLNNNELLECISAFNGFGIYRLAKINNCEYEGILNLDLFDQKDFVINQSILKRSFNFARKDDCEHRNFHVQMIKKNNARIRISPLILFK
jgi:hypothetical protein